MEYFWATENQLRVNGEMLTPEEAYKKYPQNLKELTDFVEKTKNSMTSKIDHRIETIKSQPLRKKLSEPKSAKQQDLKQLSVDKKLLEIDKTIRNIFERLEIKSASNQKELAYRLFEYVINNSKYQSAIMDEKASESSLFEMEINDIYRCLCEHRSVCSSDAAALSLLFRRAGISSTHLTIAEKGCEPQGVHEVVKMDFDGKQYICDPTLVRTCLEQKTIPNLHPSVFAFTLDKFFAKLYPTKEIKYEHEPILK